MLVISALGRVIYRKKMQQGCQSRVHGRTGQLEMTRFGIFGVFCGEKMRNNSDRLFGRLENDGVIKRSFINYNT